MNNSCCSDDIGSEHIIWQGRPAPRCYTFRHWRRALCWGVVLFLALLWQMWMWRVCAPDGQWMLVFVPAPFVLVASGLSFGRLLRARLEWEHIFYHLSDTALILQRGRVVQFQRYPYTHLRDVHLQLHDEKSASGLGWVHVQSGTERVTLECLEDAPKIYMILARQLHRHRGMHRGAQREEKSRTLL
jgi:hypothetical protein